MSCGCGASFSGEETKKCTCGNNPGGDCQCNSADSRMKRHKSKFASFMGKINKKKTRQFVDTKKLGIPDEEFFEYNPKYSGTFSNFTNESFSHKRDLGGYEY